MLPEKSFLASHFENIFRNLLFVVVLLGFFVYIFFPNLFVEMTYTQEGDTLDVEPAFEEEDMEDIFEEGGDLQVEQPVLEFKDTGPARLEGPDLDLSAFSASSLLVKDTETGKVLLSKNEYQPHVVASLSKLMSALVLLEYSSEWKATSTAVSEQAFDTFLMPGSVYASEDLWEAALIGSSNKAVLSLIDGIGISRDVFLERMNQKAMELGMLETVFRDPTGLDEANLSTASDLAILLDEAMRQEKIRLSLEKKEFIIKTVEGAYEKHMWNTDWLLLGWIPHSFARFYGGKTGYIPASGYNFVMRVGSEDGRSLDVIVLGAATHEQRFTEARDAAEWVFDNFQWSTSGTF